MVVEEDAITLALCELQFCLIDHFLTDRVINFPAMTHTMASLWRPSKGVCIKDLGIPCTCFNSFMKLILNVWLTWAPWPLINVSFYSRGWNCMHNLPVSCLFILWFGFKCMICHWGSYLSVLLLPLEIISGSFRFWSIQFYLSLENIYVYSVLFRCSVSSQT